MVWKCYVLLTTNNLKPSRQFMMPLSKKRRIVNISFWTGPVGIETYSYKSLIRTIHGGGSFVAAVASTGIADDFLPGGRTYHSQFKMPINLTENSTSSMRLTTLEARMLKNAQLIIWDESTNVTKICFQSSRPPAN